MLELLAIAAGATVLGGGGLLYRFAKRRGAHQRWKEALSLVGERLTGARPSPGTMYDAPELRAEVDDVTVTLRIIDIQKKEARGRARAIAELDKQTQIPRVFLGWDVEKTSEDFSYIPLIADSPAHRFEGEITLRGDDSAFAQAFATAANIDLIDVRREADAHGVELVCRGAYLTLVVHGIQCSEHMLERVMLATARLARLVESMDPNPSEEKRDDVLVVSKTDAKCSLCGDAATAEEPWVACRRCEALYHERCHTQATACLRDGCQETGIRRVRLKT